MGLRGLPGRLGDHVPDHPRNRAVFLRRGTLDEFTQLTLQRHADLFAFSHRLSSNLAATHAAKWEKQSTYRIAPAGNPRMLDITWAFQ
jgi:hypothetical protein